ncbi:hypothetical protein [Sneathiella chinensis]|nr:hypothetical protein [Sneathiella chinensis]
MENVTLEDLGITAVSEDAFTLTIKGYSHRLTGEELITEMTDQLDVRGSVRNALLRKAQKEILAGLKRGPLRLGEEERESFDLNILIWFADKVLKGEHKSYLTE